MSPPILLYDLARRSNTNKCWSYNVLKTRLALNYKSLSHQTIWVDHENLAPTLKALGVPPSTTPGAHAEYTVPTIKLPDADGTTTVVTDSAVIAAKLEALHPSPSLHLDAQLQADADAAVTTTAMPLFPIWMPRIARDIVTEESKDFFKFTKEKQFGVTFEELEKTKGGEQAWTAAEPGFAALKTLLTERKKDEGPFILGSQVCYADFLVVALFEALRQIGEDLFVRAVGKEEVFREVYEAGKGWLGDEE